MEKYLCSLNSYNRKRIGLDRTSSSTFTHTSVLYSCEFVAHLAEHMKCIFKLDVSEISAAAVYRQAGGEGHLSSVWLASVIKVERGTSEPGVQNVSSLGGVRVTGVQAGLCGGAAAMGAWRAVEGLGAPPQVLQRLQEGATGPFLFQGARTFLLHLCDLGEGDGLGFETGLTRSAGAALALCQVLGDG